MNKPKTIKIMPDNNEIAPIEIYLNAPLYKKYSKEVSYEVENFCSTLDMYCVGCKQESVFKRLGKTPLQLMAGMTFPMPSGGGSHYKPDPELSRTYSIEFECSRNEKHMAVFAFRVDGQSFSKIGEYPSRADRLYPEIRKYEKELGFYYEELKTAFHLHLHNVGIGSFVYLRRILEKVVYDVAVHKYAGQPNWSLEKWKESKRRFEDVIDDLANELPEFLVKNTILYGILSKGIHELDEEECQEYFEVVQAAIEEILDYKMSRDEKERRQSSVSSKLSQIHSGLKRRVQT